MNTKLTDTEISAALQSCADEPIHIPGIVQPFGCLLAVSAETDLIHYASENTNEFLGHSAGSLLGRAAGGVLGSALWQSMKDAINLPGSRTQPVSVGPLAIDGRARILRVHTSADQHVIEIESSERDDLSGGETVKDLIDLIMHIQGCETEQCLFDRTVELLQKATGFDRVLIYRFDPEWNGEVLSEVKQGPIESFLGLRFPHWDIPKQARDIMARIPLRFIQNIGQIPVPILASAGMPPLDISLAEVRGVSPVHMEYLRNMGVAATMTLSVKVNERLWGIISFHHRAPKVPPPALREVLNSFLLVFSGKLESLHRQMALDRIKVLDQGFAGQTEADYDITKMLPAAGPVILQALKAHGIAALNKGDVVGSGALPEQWVMEKLSRTALNTGDVIAIPSLIDRFPDSAADLNGVAGALIVGVLPNKAVLIFRNEIQRELAWAGNPEKTIETFGDRVRLSPRGSFSVFLEHVRGRCEHWTENDIYLVGHLRTLLHAAERQAIMNTMNRQQTLMIGELNHRVRNILALVRSVSRQARRRYASLDSYANAIENRIRALAAAHDISGGRSVVPVSIHDLVRLEFEPFRTLTDVQTLIEGPDMYLLPEVAPIFSLVIHELTTNAAKYGALVNADGRITVNLVAGLESFKIQWRETGGPAVKRPDELGFGMALIEKAVPHELGGTATVEFDADGLTAEFALPLRHFTSAPTSARPARIAPIQPDESFEMPEILCAGTVMVLEDNYIIAKETADHLSDLGCKDVRTCSSVEAAFQIVEKEALVLAVLDVNLGAKETSEPIALRLAEQNVPFVFVTGYGEGAELPRTLDKVPRLTKPISSTEFVTVAARLLTP